MYVGGASTLRRTPGYQQAVNLLVGFVQSRLSQYEEYECEEKDDNFLLAFRSPIQAAHFVQREAMDLDWPEHLLEQDAAAEVVKLAESVDLRLQIGLCIGIPTTAGRTRPPAAPPISGRWSTASLPQRHRGIRWQTMQEVFQGAKGQAQGILFQELGEYGLKSELWVCLG
eukprot:jgi/Mesvir1/3939/Mv17844-RA.1